MKGNEEITIPIIEFQDLIVIRQKYYVLINYLFDNVRLSYDKQELRFKNENLELLRYFEPLKYKNIIDKLIEEEKDV